MTMPDRPVNKRNYWSPAFWVQGVELGEKGPRATYLDYTFGTDYNEIMKRDIQRERTFLNGGISDLEDLSVARTLMELPYGPTDIMGKSEYAASYRKADEISASNDVVAAGQRLPHREIRPRATVTKRRKRPVIASPPPPAKPAMQRSMPTFCASMFCAKQGSNL